MNEDMKALLAVHDMLNYIEGQILSIKSAPAPLLLAISVGRETLEAYLEERAPDGLASVAPDDLH